MSQNNTATTNNALLIIDPQVDFCSPQGSLFVPGADADMQRLGAWITQNANNLQLICYTMDSHPVNAIFHPSWFIDSTGAHPSPFTSIQSGHLLADRWFARFEAEATLQYLSALEDSGLQHTIWPEHCLTGTLGACVEPQLMQVLLNWTRTTGKSLVAETKGINPLTEHFGIFKAQIAIESDPTTQLNTKLINLLNQYDALYLAGEAKSHCVAATLQQAMDFAPQLAAKMVILENCMSPVPGFEAMANATYAQAKAMGIKFITV